jgi:hypothetical protein
MNMQGHEHAGRRNMWTIFHQEEKKHAWYQGEHFFPLQVEKTVDQCLFMKCTTLSM